MRETTGSPTLRATRFFARGIAPRAEGEISATERQERLPGFVQARRHTLREILVGAGGINGEIGVSEVRKGIGYLLIIDHDTVELSNLNRQRFFEEDLYKNKAECLARNLVREATSRCVLTSYPHRFQDAVVESFDLGGDVVVVGVDNNETRVAVARRFLAMVPVVLVAVSEDAEHGYVFVQEPGKACYGCLFPKAVGDLTHHPCSPAVIDILKVVAGVASYAIDSLVMDRRRSWNYKEIFLSGVLPERNALIERRKDCPICSVGESS